MRWMSAKCFLASAESRSVDGAIHPPNPTLRRGPWTAIVEREQKDDDISPRTRTHRESNQDKRFHYRKTLDRGRRFTEVRISH